MCRQFPSQPTITSRNGLETSPQRYPRPIEYYLIPAALFLIARVPSLLSPSVAGLGLLTNSLPNAGNWYHMLSIFSSVSQSPLRLLSNKLLWISELLFLLPQMNLNYNFLGVSRWLQARVKFNEPEAAEFMLWIAKSFKILKQGRKLWRNRVAPQYALSRESLFHQLLCHNVPHPRILFNAISMLWHFFNRTSVSDCTKSNENDDQNKSFRNFLAFDLIMVFIHHVEEQLGDEIVDKIVSSLIDLFLGVGVGDWQLGAAD